MNDPGSIRHYEHMWTTDLEDFVLVHLGKEVDDSDRYAIVRKSNSATITIEDNDDYEEVKRQLLLAGVKIIDLTELKTLIQARKTADKS
ncbi:MAG: hypothetical protein IT320_15870 [Anaerolineae bacterium]|nr:hypothetical protein [Anaerolineae bacterium]